MNIQMLLSAAQGQNNPPGLQSSASKTGVREAGLFDNALAKAALLAEGTAAKSQASAQPGKSALDSRVPYTELLQSLEAGSLDLDISAQELEALLEQSQTLVTETPSLRIGAQDLKALLEQSPTSAAQTPNLSISAQELEALLNQSQALATETSSLRVSTQDLKALLEQSEASATQTLHLTINAQELEALLNQSQALATETSSLRVSTQDLKALLEQSQASATQTLHLTINAQDLEALLEQPQDGLAAESTGLDEIAARLALLAEFDTLEVSTEGISLQEGEALTAAQEVSLQQLRTALQSSEKVAELMQRTETSQAEIAPLIQLTELARSMASSSAQTSTSAQGSDSSRVSLLDALATSQQAQARLNDKGEQPARAALDTTQLQRPISESMANSVVDSRLAGGNPPTSDSSLAAGMQAQPSSQSQPSLVGLNAATSPPAQASISTPVTHQAWPQQLGQQLMQFTQRGGEQQIQMQIHPAELGPLSISLKVSEQGTQAHFLSAHAQVRQVIEQAIPQLREALAEQGISLGETSVGDQSDGREFADQKSPSQPGTDTIGTAASDSEGDAQASTTLAASLEGRVDLYA